MVILYTNTEQPTSQTSERSRLYNVDVVSDLNVNLTYNEKREGGGERFQNISFTLLRVSQKA